MAAATKKRAASSDALPQSKRQRSLGRGKTEDDEAWEPPSQDGDVDTPVASTASSPGRTPQTEQTNSIADTSLTSASSGKRPKVYFCEYENCGKAFDRPVRLQMHIRSHTNERPFACPEDGCDKKFIRNEHLQAHIKGKHNDERTYYCTYVLRGVDGTEEKCDKSFHTGSRLRRHLAMHEEKEQTRCQECGKEFRKQETLQRHIKSAHLKENAYRCTHVEIGVMMDDEAEECGRTFATARQLRSHEARDHSGERYFCQICSPDRMDDNADTTSMESSAYGFPSYAELQVHIKTVHPPTCPDCGQACESNRALKAHMDIFHSALAERQNFPCTHPGCDRKFTKKGNMQVHVQTVHAKARNFTCGDFDLSKSKKTQGWDARGCGHSFGTKANLEEHVRTQHMNLLGSFRPSKSVKSSGTSTPAGPVSMLTGHGYTEERPIACMLQGCPHRFLRDFDLATHLELGHGWNIDDVNDAMAEKEARESGKFWIGGGGMLEAQEDVELRQRLIASLQLEQRQENKSVLVGNGLQDFLQDVQMGEEGVNAGTGQPMIDPALMSI